jgi:uncharacterized protein (DUF1697 family)
VLQRGANVGGHRKIPMADFRDELTEAGCGNPRSYIQTGNVLIDDGPDADGDVSALFSSVLADRFGLDDVPVVVLPVKRLGRARQVSAEQFPTSSDEVRHAKLVHVHYATGAGTSKLTLDRIERAFGVRATARNLNTIDRLIALVDR